MTRIHIRLIACSLARALRMVWSSAPQLALAQALLAITQALLPLMTIFALKQAVDAATALIQTLPSGGATNSNGSWSAILHNASGREVALWLIIGATAIGANACLRALATWVSEQHAMAVSDHVHAKLHNKLLSVDLAFFENSDEQNRLHLAQSQAMTRPIRVLDSLFQILQGTVGFLGVLLLLAAFQPWVAVALALAGIPALIFRLYRGQRLYKWRRDLAPLEREVGYFNHLLTDGEYAKELRLQGHGNFCCERFIAVRRCLREARLIWRRYVLSRELIMQFVMLAITATLLFWMTGRLFAGAITLGALVMYAQAIQRGQGQLSLLAGAIGDLYQSALFLQAFDELMELPARVIAPAIPLVVPTPIRQGIVFDHVSFTYPGTDRPILCDISFTIGPSEHVTLIGANGAGKSTLIKLLCRLYDPTSGRILIDGVDLRELDPMAWRQRIGVLFQDFGRYQLTAAENIWIGDPYGMADDSRIAAVANRMGLTEIIHSWPQGLDTPLGRWLHPGTEPSAGEWQRIALARALLRESDLLIMDEPSSMLDARSRCDLISLLQVESAGRATLMVSHQSDMLSWAKRVIVLNKGVVVEDGDADVLRSGNGEFARLFKQKTERPEV